MNAAWDRIVPAFGFVAVNHTWAAEHNLPASMGLPSDSSKGVYIIDASVSPTPHERCAVADVCL